MGGLVYSDAWGVLIYSVVGYLATYCDWWVWWVLGWRCWLVVVRLGVVLRIRLPCRDFFRLLGYSFFRGRVFGLLLVGCLWVDGFVVWFDQLFLWLVGFAVLLRFVADLLLYVCLLRFDRGSVMLNSVVDCVLLLWFRAFIVVFGLVFPVYFALAWGWYNIGFWLLGLVNMGDFAPGWFGGICVGGCLV